MKKPIKDEPAEQADRNRQQPESASCGEHHCISRTCRTGRHSYKSCAVGAATRPEPISQVIKRTLAYTSHPTTWLDALLGVGAMETFFRLAPRVGLSRIDNSTSNGTYLLPPGRKASLLGFSMFYSGAVVLVSLFRSSGSRIKGSPQAKSLKFGVALYLFSSLAVMPLLGATNPYMRRGILKKPGLLGLGIDGWKTPASNLIGHLIFSQIIGIRKLNK